MSLTNNKTDWERFREDLEKTIQMHTPLKTSYQLENDMDALVEATEQAAWNSTLLKATQDISYPLEVREHANAKRKARGKMAAH